MALSIKNPETEALARRLAERTGEGITEAIHAALEMRLEYETRLERADRVLAEIALIREELARYPVLDDRDPNEWMYDADGLPA